MGLGIVVGPLNGVADGFPGSATTPQQSQLDRYSHLQLISAHVLVELL